MTYLGALLLAIQPPPPAIAAGFNRLTLDEEFADERILDRWALGLWWQRGVSSDAITVHDGIATITARAKPLFHATMLTTWGGPVRRTLRYGYFEARMRWPVSSGNWAAFWLISKETTKEPDPKKWPPYCEIDILEAFGGGYQSTVHDWMTHAKETDYVKTHIYRFYRSSNFHPDRWHTYGMLWRKGVITFYRDGKMTATMVPPTVCDNQDQILVFGTQRRGEKQESTDFDWVRVWQ
jgi:beta-glucanase (GH16 family)